MKVLCLLMILSVAAVYQAEAGWWRKATNFVGSAVGTVAGFLGKKHRRRALREVLDEETMKEVDNLCTQEHLDDLTVDGIPFEMVKATFQKVEEGGNQNDALDGSELDKFLNAMEVYQHCMNQKNGDLAPAA